MAVAGRLLLTHFCAALRPRRSSSRLPVSAVAGTASLSDRRCTDDGVNFIDVVVGSGMQSTEAVRFQLVDK